MSADAQALEVEAVAELVQASADADLYLAAYRSRLESQVKAGENRGRLLTHDYVVLEWQGPFAFAGKTLTERRKLPLLPGAAPANSGWRPSCRTGAPARCSRPFFGPPAKSAC